MKKLLLFLLCLPLFLFSQDAKPPSLHVVLNMKVKAGQDDAFKAAVKSHNAEYHSEGLYKASLYYNINGPSGGTYTWIMGPTNYTAMDDRPKSEAHDADWDKIKAMCDHVSPPGYWSFDSKHSHIAGDGPAPAKRLIWMYDIKRGQGARWAELVGKVKEVYEKKRPDEFFITVWNEFNDTQGGNDAVIVFPFEKWAWLDRKSDFAKLFDEVHGPGSWHNFLNEFAATVDGRVDWLRNRVD